MLLHGIIIVDLSVHPNDFFDAVAFLTDIGRASCRLWFGLFSTSLRLELFLERELLGHVRGAIDAIQVLDNLFNICCCGDREE